jgi:hypothetical protein
MQISRRELLRDLTIAGVGTYATSAAALTRSRSLSTTSTVINIVDYGASADPNAPINNVPAIQAAIDALPSEGGGVFVPPGVWHVDYSEVNAIFLDSNVHLFGAGDSSVLNVATKTSSRTDVITNRDWSNGNFQCRVSNLSINCNRHGSYGYGADFRINGITFKNCRESSVGDMKIIDGYGYGVYFFSTKKSTINNCYIRDFNDCIELSNGSTGNVVIGNIIESTGTAFYVSSGIYLFAESDFNTISSNTLNGKFGQGISTASEYGPANGNIFTANSLNLDRTPGIVLSGYGNSYTGNCIKVNGQPSIFMDEVYGGCNDIAISGNLIYSDLKNTESRRKAAILISDLGKSVSINGNTIIAEGGEAIRVLGKDIIITSNQIRNFDLAEGYGVVCQNESDNVIINGNIIEAMNSIVLPEESNIILSNNILKSLQEPLPEKTTEPTCNIYIKL